MELKIRQPPSVHGLTESLGTASLCFRKDVSSSRLSICMFSLIAARLDACALDLLRFCSKDSAEKPWLKAVGSVLCGRECHQMDFLGCEPAVGRLEWVGLLSNDLEKGEKKEQRLLFSEGRAAIHCCRLWEHTGMIQGTGGLTAIEIGIWFSGDC